MEIPDVCKGCQWKASRPGKHYPCSACPNVEDKEVRMNLADTSNVKLSNKEALCFICKKNMTLNRHAEHDIPICSWVCYNKLSIEIVNKIKSAEEYASSLAKTNYNVVKIVLDMCHHCLFFGVNCQGTLVREPEAHNLSEVIKHRCDEFEPLDKSEKESEKEES